MGGEEKRLFASKKNFGEPYACKQTTALASFMHFICGRATKESANLSSQPREKQKRQAQVLSKEKIERRRREDYLGTRCVPLNCCR